MKDFRGKKVIVYGLGKEYERQRPFLENEFEIIGYSDKKQKNIPLYIMPQYINKKDFDYIYITSNKFFKEIKKDLLSMVGGGGNENYIFKRLIRRFFEWSGTERLDYRAVIEDTEGLRSS